MRHSWSDAKCKGLSLGSSTPEAATGRRPPHSRWPSRASERPWEIRLTNLQELLDPLDIVKKYAGIRIQDVYNTMLRTGWTLGSPQLLKVLAVRDSAIPPAHGPLARSALEGNRAGHADFLRAAFQSRDGRKFSIAHFQDALRNRTHGHRGLSAAFLDRAPTLARAGANISSADRIARSSRRARWGTRTTTFFARRE